MAAVEAITAVSDVPQAGINIFPEFACQLYSYLQSPELDDDLHALVDIGAGTLDVAYFNVFVKQDGEAVLPVFASAVEKLGAHYLIAALAGKGSKAVWSDNEAALDDASVARKIESPKADVVKRRSVYLSSVASVFDGERISARNMYQTSPAFRDGAGVRLFLCGGGSRIPCLQQRFDRIAVESAVRLGIQYQVSSLVSPRNLVGDLGASFDRVSVAYGLAQPAVNIGNVMRSGSLEPLAPAARVEIRDRDEDR